MKSAVYFLLLLLLAFLTVLMVNLSLPYLAFDDHVAFLRIKQWIIHNSVWKSAFYTHVITSSFCLLAGFTQFSAAFIKDFPKAHRRLGYIYMITILLFAGPSGLVMSFFANGGLLSQTAFILLSVLWLSFTFSGYNTIRKRNYSSHQKFMIRSYALTLSALTLRLWKMGIVFAFRPHPMDTYMIVAWLGWLPNLLLAEIYIRYKLSTIKKLKTL